MTNEMTNESTMLARARAGLSPSEADRARVGASLAAALASAAPLLPAAHGALPMKAGVGWTARLLVATTLAAAAGTGGYWAGYRAGRDDAPQPAALRDDVARPAAASPAVRAPVLEQEVPPASTPEPRAAEPARASRPRRNAAPTTNAASLEAEVRALRAVERALRDHEPGMALALLRELDRAVPDGQLVEEREATAAIARCALGDVPFGVDPARDFREHHPDSVYLDRVAQGCAGR